MERKTELREYISSLPVIDTHEHLENECNQPEWNVLSDYTRHYFSCDLISSGLDPEKIRALARDDVDIMKKWLSIENHWEACRYTGYGRMLDLSVQKLYGVPELNRDTIETVERGYQALRANPGYSGRILRDKCGIERVMNNIWHLNGDSDGGLYWFVTQVDGWIAPDRAMLARLQNDGAEFSDVDDWAELCLNTLNDDFSLRGAKGLKMGLAYTRCLLFEETDHAPAQAAFDKWLGGNDDFSAIKPMQDYIAHKIFRWADENGLLIQIHTGYQESNAARITDSEPSQLINVILKYPHMRFDIFHMGFPYQDVAGAMGKMYPNVYLNLCWTHILSPVAAQRALDEWLQLVPRNKIFAFGGDCLFFDGVVGHLELARSCVAGVLSHMVEDGMMSMTEAKRTARMLFYDNPKEFYRM